MPLETHWLANKPPSSHLLLVGPDHLLMLNLNLETIETKNGNSWVSEFLLRECSSSISSSALTIYIYMICFLQRQFKRKLWWPQRIHQGPRKVCQPPVLLPRIQLMLQSQWQPPHDYQEIWILSSQGRIGWLKISLISKRKKEAQRITLVPRRTCRCHSSFYVTRDLSRQGLFGKIEDPIRRNFIVPPTEPKCIFE